MDDFEEIKQLVFHYLRGIWKNRWIAILIAWPILIGGVVMVDQMKDRYTAKTKIYIDTYSILRPLLRGLAVQTDIQSNVSLMVRTLLTRPNLERVVRLMDMDIETRSKQEMNALINQVRRNVRVSSQNRSNTYTITYSDYDPQRAKKIVQTLLDIFVEDTLGKTSSASDTASEFLNSQIAKYEKLLIESEERLENFKRKNVGINPGSGAGYYAQLKQVNASLEEAKLSLTEATNRRDNLQSQLDNLSTTELVAATNSKYDARIQELESRIDDLLIQYTEQHPDVIYSKNIKATLEQKRLKELEEIKQKRQSGVSNAEDPVRQQLQILLNESQATVSSLNARVASYEKKAQELSELVDTAPRIESELKRLDRDYGLYKKNYNSLIAKREQVRMGEDVESGTEQVKFRILEPPTVPSKASYPNRPLFDTGILIMALGIGYGISLLISLFQPIFYNASDLKRYTDYAVLGAVSKFDTPDVLKKRRRNLILFGLTNLLLIVTAFALIIMHSKGILILSTVQQMVTGL